MAALGLIAIAAAVVIANESPLARWTLTETLAPARVLPLIGLGAAFGLLGTRAVFVALVFFAGGIAGGLAAEDRLLMLLDAVPRAATHLFLTGPISYLAAGAVLIASTRWRPYVAPVAALIFGAMLALTIKLTDPSLHEPAYTWSPVMIAFWMIAAVTLSLRAFRRGWFATFGRILGSWLLAIGLLYGGASLLPKRAPPPPPAVALPPLPGPGPGGAIPGLPVPDQPAPFPGGGNNFRQP